MRTALVLVIVAGCAGDATVGSLSEAVGEQQNGFPNPWERALFMAANRARSDPATVKGAQSTILPAQPPLALTYDLERSARFHAVTLENGKAPLMHESPCTLNTNVGTSGCDGNPSCACTSDVCGCASGSTCDTCKTCPAGTPPFTRIGYFFKGANGEVAAAGYGDPWGVMDGWVDEAAGSDGHRQIVDGAGSKQVGFGHSGAVANACWNTFDVGDFGGGTPTVPLIASAAPKPYTGKAGTFRMYASWADPKNGAPTSLAAVVDGKCATMTREIGTDKLNATYYADVTLANGCHSVWILGTAVGGTRATYPSTKAFNVSVGGASCADEVAQPAADCDGTVGNGGSGGAGSGGGGTGGSGNGGTGGAGNGGAGNGGAGNGGGGTSGGAGNGGGGTSGGAGNGGAGNGGGGSGGDNGGNGADDPGGSNGTGGVHGGCAMAPAHAPAPSAALLWLAGALLLRRRRRT